MISTPNVPLPKNLIAYQFLLVLFLGTTELLLAQDKTAPIEKLHAAVSQYYYESDSLQIADRQKGVVPVPIIVTEPALGGFGGGLGIGYVHSNKRSFRKNTPATITGVFGGMSLNKSWLYGMGHSQTLNNDHIRYLGYIFNSKVNMAFYEEILSRTFSFDVNMNLWGTSHKVLFRIKETNLFVGTKYTFAKTKNKLDLVTNHPKLDSLLSKVQNTSKLGMLGVVVSYDSRDNTLSPNRGVDVALYYDYNATFFGGDQNFSMLEASCKYYFQVASSVYGGLRADGQFTGNNTPFYSKPYIELRGVPAMRYQGNMVFLTETQWRWVFYKNWSVLGFAGAAKALKEIEDFNDEKTVYNYGVGARYALNKIFGLRVGIDTAWSNDDFAWYISVGSSF